MIDTHCHLNFSAFKDDAEAIVAEMRKINLQAIVVGSQSTTSTRAVELAHRFPETLFAAVALHPLQLFSRNINEVEFPFKTRAEAFDEAFYLELAQDPKVIAIGECGLDYFTFPEGISEQECKKKQEAVFRRHIFIASKLHLPLLIHARSHPSNHRDAHEDIFRILEDEGRPQAVWHALATHPDMAKKIVDAGYLVGFTGLITHTEYREALEACVRLTPIEQMVLETDSPYMSLEGKRNTRNTPLAVFAVAKEVARIHGVSVETVIFQTTRNATQFFSLT